MEYIKDIYRPEDYELPPSSEVDRVLKNLNKEKINPSQQREAST